SKVYEGYYNGKAMVTLMPKTERALMHKLDPYFYERLADRNYDMEYLQVGALTDIEYSTGGKTNFEYEPNAIGENLEEPKLEEFGISLSTGPGFGPWSEDDPEAPNYYVFSTLVELDNVSNQIYFSVPQEFY